MALRESTSAQLKITSATLTAKDIEARLGVKPDESWKIGDRTGIFGAVQKANGFVLVSAMPLTASIEAHVSSLLKRVAPVAAKIGEIAPQATIKMTCTLQRKVLPPICFERDDLRWLGVMGAQLEIEMGLVADAAREAAPKLPPTKF